MFGHLLKMQFIAGTEINTRTHTYTYISIILIRIQYHILN